MSRIRTLTVVTDQSVNTYRSDKNTEIKAGTYWSLGDPFDCFHIIKNGDLVGEIRCIHQLEIEYWPCEKQE